MSSSEKRTADRFVRSYTTVIVMLRGYVSVVLEVEQSSFLVCLSLVRNFDKYIVHESWSQPTGYSFTNISVKGGTIFWAPGGSRKVGRFHSTPTPI